MKNLFAVFVLSVSAIALMCMGCHSAVPKTPENPSSAVSKENASAAKKACITWGDKDDSAVCFRAAKSEEGIRTFEVIQK